MQLYVLISLFGFAYVGALECGIGPSIDNNLRNAIATCLRNNSSMNSIFDFSSLTSKETDVVTQRSLGKTVNTTSSYNATTPKTSGAIRKVRNVKTQSRQMATTTVEPETETDVTTEEATSPEESCIIQCVLSNLNLTDKTGYPEQEKIVEGLMKNAKGRELKDFLQDTADVCFQRVNEDAGKNECDYSTELVKCLADSGRSNCGDWPAGNIALFK